MALNTYAMPADTQVPLAGNPAGNMNSIVDALNAAGVPVTVLNTAYSSGADPTGTNDSYPAFLAAINGLPAGGGAVIVPSPGTYTVATAIPPVSGLKLISSGTRGSTSISSTASSVINAGASATDTVEIAGLTLQATGHDIFTGANCKRWNVHDCQFIQNSAGNAIWNAPTVQIMIECVFQRNLEQISGATRTVEAWFLSAPNNNQQINANVWRDEVCFNNGNDAAMYWYHVQATGGTTINTSNRFENITIEHPYGGMIWAESAINTVIDQVLAWDTTNTIANSLIYISKNSGGQASTNTEIRSSGRNGSQTLGAGISDIQLDANCSQTLISNPRGNSGVFIDLGNSAKVTLLGLPSTYTLRNTATATYATSFTSNVAAPFGSTPTAPANTVSTTLVMMGLGTAATGTAWAFTPGSSGKVIVTVTGLVTNAAAGVTTTFGGRYGTGTAPTNGTAVTGTRFGAAADLAAKPQTGGTGVPFALTAQLALTAGTAYWFDLALDTANAADAASVSDVSITVMETS